MSTTPPMLVRSVTISTSSTITFRFKTPFQAPLFLGLMTIAKNTGIVGVTGVISPGTDATHGGTANLQMSADHYDAIVAFVNSQQGQGLFVQLEFQGLTPTEVIVGSTQPQAALSLHASDIALSDKLDSLNENLQVLLSTLGSINPPTAVNSMTNNGATT